MRSRPGFAAEKQLALGFSLRGRWKTRHHRRDGENPARPDTPTVRMRILLDPAPSSEVFTAILAAAIALELRDI
jgi:hypothetical protein